MASVVPDRRYGRSCASHPHRRMQHCAYPSNRVARCMAPGPCRGACRPCSATAEVGLCRLLHTYFREYLFHALG
jgi:hypothetical protein